MCTLFTYSSPNFLPRSQPVQAVSLIAQGYPRGSKQLIGPFKSLFGPTDAAAWFGSRGVRLKTEGDGRMFPVTDDSQTIIDCLEGESIMGSCARRYRGGMYIYRRTLHTGTRSLHLTVFIP